MANRIWCVWKFFIAPDGKTPVGPVQEKVATLRPQNCVVGLHQTSSGTLAEQISLIISLRSGAAPRRSERSKVEAAPVTQRECEILASLLFVQRETTPSDHLWNDVSTSSSALDSRVIPVWALERLKRCQRTCLFSHNVGLLHKSGLFFFFTSRCLFVYIWYESDW